MLKSRGFSKGRFFVHLDLYFSFMKVSSLIQSSILMQYFARNEDKKSVHQQEMNMIQQYNTRSIKEYIVVDCIQMQILKPCLVFNTLEKIPKFSNYNNMLKKYTNPKQKRKRSCRRKTIFFLQLKA